MMDELQQNEQPITEPNGAAIVESVRGSNDPVQTGRRLSFSNLRRQLTDEELSNPGVQKLLLDMLEEAENECNNLKTYVSSYYSADKTSAILNEKLTKNNQIEVFFGVGVGLGGALLGLIPFLGKTETLYGVICGIIGLVLVIGSSIGRLLKR